MARDFGVLPLPHRRHRNILIFSIDCSGGTARPLHDELSYRPCVTPIDMGMKSDNPSGRGFLMHKREGAHYGRGWPETMFKRNKAKRSTLYKARIKGGPKVA